MTRAGEQIDRYTRELHRIGLDTSEREVRWLNELIDHERSLGQNGTGSDRSVEPPD
jgi:hypothetical protein